MALVLGPEIDPASASLMIQFQLEDAEHRPKENPTSPQAKTKHFVCKMKS